MSFGQWLGLVVIIICFYVLWEIRQLLLLLFMALVLAIALNLLVQQLQRYHLKRWQALLLAVFLLLGVFIGSFWLIIPALVAQIQELITLVPEGIEKLIIELTELATIIEPELTSIWPGLSQLINQLQPLIREVLNQGLSIFYASLGQILSFLLLLALTLMLLASPQPYRSGFIRLFPSFYRRRVEEILTLCNQALSSWLITVFFHIGVMFICSWLGLLIFQIPLAFSQAFLSGFLTFIPNLGPIFAMIPPIAIALLEASWKPWAVIFLYIGIYVIIKHIDHFFLSPKVLKRHISLIPGITFIAQIIFAYNFGFMGLFLAFPLLIIIQVWVKESLIKDILEEWKKKQNEI